MANGPIFSPSPNSPFMRYGVRKIAYAKLRFYEENNKMRLCFGLDFLCVLRKGKTKALSAAPFDLFIFSVSCGQNKFPGFPETCLLIVHEQPKKKKKWRSRQSLRKTIMKHVSSFQLKI